MIGIKERLFWIFLTGSMVGFLVFFLLNQTMPLSTSKVSENQKYPLIELVDSYLKTYYIEPNALNNQNMMYGAAQGLVNSLGDEYTILFTPSVFKAITSDISGTIAGIGVYLQKKQNEVFILSLVPLSPAFKAGLKTGDKLISVNEIPIANFSIEEISSRIQGEENSWVTLDIFRPSIQKYKTIKVLRSLISVPSVYTQTLQKNIQYIKITDFSDNTAQEVQKVLKNNKLINSLIIDLRNNPGGQLESAETIASFLLPPKTNIVSTKSPIPQENKIYNTEPNQNIFPTNKPIIVLVNEQSASAAEILAAALQDNKRALLIGKKTFGKASVQNVFPIEYEHQTLGLKITVAHYLTPQGKDINHIGLKPDIEVSLPIITPQDQASLEYLSEHIDMIEKYLGKKLSKPLSKDILQKIKQELLSKNIILSDVLLSRLIKEQQNMYAGQLNTIEYNFDTQIAKAVQILNSKENQ